MPYAPTFPVLDFDPNVVMAMDDATAYLVDALQEAEHAAWEVASRLDTAMDGTAILAPEMVLRLNGFALQARDLAETLRGLVRWVAPSD